jgi:predicted acetyltransferase
MLEFARATEADWPDMNHVWAWVYTNQPPDEDLDPEPENMSRWIVRDNGRAVSVCQLYHYDLARGEDRLSCGGVGGVATLIEARQTGAAHILMEGLIRGMREMGFATSALYGYKESYYRRFGYEACGWRWQITVPTERLPKTRVSLPVRQIAAEDAAVLDEAYLPFIESLSGSHVRTADDWKKRLGKKPSPIYAVGDPIEGYAWVNLKEFWGEATVGEMGWTTREGYESILGVLRGACSNQSRLIWNEPPTSPFLSRFLDQGMELKVARPTMFRAVHVPKALESLTSEEDLDFTLEIGDDLLPENNGPWRVICVNGTTTVEATDQDPDFTLSIGGFSQALMGQPSLLDLFELELVEVRNGVGFAQGAHLLSPMPVVCMEFF